MSVKGLLRGSWQFCSYVFVPQRRPKEDTCVKREDVWVAKRESLMEGCYHEMGHVLATFHYFPNEERIESISFAKKPSGGFMFDTNYHIIQWSLPSQKETLIMCSIGGGIFQQMKMIYGEIKIHSEFNKSSVGVLREYFSKHIKCPIDGMEADLAYLDYLYSVLLYRRKDIEPLNLDDEKEKAIDLFMPYLENKKIDELCECIVKEMLAVNGAHDTVIGVKDIMAYLRMS